MAKKSKIDNSLPLSYRELQKLNAQEFQQAQVESPFANLRPVRDYRPIDFDYTGPVRSPLLEQGNGDYWGSSMFDEQSATPEQFSNVGELSDIRAKNQPLLAKWGSALGNGVMLAGTTFVDGVVGLLFGGTAALGSAIEDAITKDISWSNARENTSKIFYNEFSNAMQEINRTVQNNVLPFYRTQESQNEAWYEHLGSVDFWADGFLKNLGFTVGALYSGGFWTKALKSMKLLKNSSTLGAQLAGSLISAVNEGRIEANNTAYDFLTNSKKILDNSLEERRQELLADPTLNEYQKQSLFEQVQQNYQSEIERQNAQA